jgi:glucokinase
MTLANDPWVLIADIGGTNARFAAVSRSTGVAGAPVILPTKGHPTFLDAYEMVLASLRDRPGLCGMVLAVAGPIDAGRVKLTNADWHIDTAAIAATTGVAAVEVINDFEALALALPDIDASRVEVLQPGVPVPGGNLAVVGPGTGLGVAGMVALPGGGWQALCGEGGHVTYAPETEIEWRIARELKARHGRVSTERIACGQGLVEVAAILGADPGIITPAEVVAAAVQGVSPQCAAAMRVFLVAVGRCAGDVALTVNATAGVYLGGGILPRIAQAVDWSPLLEAFVDKGRNGERMRRIPVRLIVDPNPALIGLSARARALLARL